MYTVDQNNVITRVSDSKVIPRDITNKEYQDFLYVQSYRINPLTGARVTNFKSTHASHD